MCSRAGAVGEGIGDYKLRDTKAKHECITFFRPEWAKRPHCPLGATAAKAKAAAPASRAPLSLTSAAFEMPSNDALNRNELSSDKLVGVPVGAGVRARAGGPEVDSAQL